MRGREVLELERDIRDARTVCADASQSAECRAAWGRLLLHLEDKLKAVRQSGRFQP
jgi:hypothetical protein